MYAFTFFVRRMGMCLVAAVTLSATPVLARDIAAGDLAPAIEMKATNGKTFNLEDQQGRMVILEWTNHECPFVRKHYDSGNMQKLQQFSNNNGMVWVSVISSAKGKQGNVDAEMANKIAADNYATPDYILIDETGEIGRKYGAKTTPHMFLIGSDGKVIYNGAIDSINSVDHDDIERADKYFYNALIASKKNEMLDIAQSKPYGCSIKY